MATAEQLSRPQTTDELVRRLNKLIFTPRDGQTLRVKKEALALRALSQSMATVFAKHPQRPYAFEAASVSPFVEDDDYRGLFNDFAEKIAQNKIPDAAILESFNTLLRSPHARRLHGLPLGHVIKFILDGVQNTKGTFDQAAIYDLLRAASAVLDAMNEVHFPTLGDAEVMMPLIDWLDGACKHHELRFSESARYAREALRGIGSDVSPWTKLGKAVFAVGKDAAKVASSVSSLDPHKLLEGLEGALDSIPALIGAISEVKELVKPVVTDTVAFISSASKVVDEGGNVLKPRPSYWYFALRSTDLFIRGKAATALGAMLENPELKCKQDENFLCGLCAQLEQASNDNVKSSNDLVIKTLSTFLTKQARSSKSKRVHEWVWLTVKLKVHEEPSRIGNLLSKLPGGTKMSQRLFKRQGAHNAYGTDLGNQRARPKEGGNALLSKAWEDCSEAQVFYADEVIRGEYTGPGRKKLTIERLHHGRCVPMDHCYINLVDLKDDEHAPLTTSVSLRRRLATWEPNEGQRLSLPDLYSQPRPSDAVEQPAHYGRVLIRGQAGVGKTTLCRKVVHDYIYRDMWADIIDRVIWLPLRKLKGENKRRYDIETLLHEWYFKSPGEGQLLGNALCSEIMRKQSRTLFILDGLDEVSQEVEESDLLPLLLNLPRVIITTRPNAVAANQLVTAIRTIETVGFYAGQVKQYINAVAPEHSAEIQKFLKEHPSIEGLARIPIQLDAICYSFEANVIDPGKTPKNMTELYGLVVQALWQKDVVQLGKQRPGTKELIGMSEASEFLPNELKRWVRGEINVLEAIAFVGISNSTEEFGRQYLDDVWDDLDVLTQQLSKPRPEFEASSGDLRKLSFLRDSDGAGSTSASSSYHFLHLTFQEYFAAQYFVHHWPDKQLAPVGATARELLCKEKYNPRYDIMWR
ncbi:hypothetical protein GQ53DRAFT_658583, partial [Thozetella sp. PMI_491]